MQTVVVGQLSYPWCYEHTSQKRHACILCCLDFQHMGPLCHGLSFFSLLPNCQRDNLFCASLVGWLGVHKPSKGSEIGTTLFFTNCEWDNRSRYLSTINEWSSTIEMVVILIFFCWDDGSQLMLYCCTIFVAQKWQYFLSLMLMDTPVYTQYKPCESHGCRGDKRRRFLVLFFQDFGSIFDMKSQQWGLFNKN